MASTHSLADLGCPVTRGFSGDLPVEYSKDQYEGYQFVRK